ncbi:MAG: hypothetical protein KHX03_06350 [Clostridium sp.]|nr:hypothetical protein [Clostridium sp.]
MEYPVFDIPYQDAYTSVIEFNTTINEKMKGHEQRYPVWTYPKRTFTLKFDKNPKGRQKLEEFFIKVMGQAGKFYFTWEKSKGGNGKKYLCNFDTDSFKQNLKDFGFSECEIDIVTIDDSPVEQVGELDFYYKAECDFVLEFYTIVDKIFTSRNERKAWWDEPKRSWTLTFEKNAKVRKQLEEFFIAKRGKFRSFKWTWKKELGGDGKTYNVRFDNDSLKSEIETYGFGAMEVKIKEVFPNENPLSEVEKDEIIPRKLLKIDLQGGSVYVLDNETLESLRYNGEDYIGAPLTFDEIKKDDSSSVSKLNIQLSNVALAISGIIGQRGDVITNAPAVLTLVFLDLNTNILVPGTKQVLYAGRCNNLKLDYENATMDIETALGGYEIQAPAMKYRTTCQVRRFKDCRCGYTGEETSCDRTFERCKELGNHENFRGYPQMYNELVIKV